MTDEEKEQAKLNARRMISAQLSFWMTDRKMDRFALHKACGVHHDSIYKILRGNRGTNGDSLALLAAGLRIPISTLLTPLGQNDSNEDQE